MALAAFKEKISGTEAEKIIRRFKRAENMGFLYSSMMPQYIMDELTEVGIQMETQHVEYLFKLVTNYHNNSRLWFLCGWKPNEPASNYREVPSSI